jgi:serine protease
MDNGTRGYLQGLLAARSQKGSAFSAESLHPEDLDPQARPQTDDVLSRVDKILQQMPPEDVPDPDEFRRACKLFLSQAEPALRKLDRDPAAPLDAAEMLSLEAVIKVDGTRPTLLVRNDTINPDHPLAGAWRDTFYSVRDSMRKRAAAVGRIGPSDAGASRYFGTGWLVDCQKGLVLTNRHVLNGIPATTRTAEGSRFAKDSVIIDFAAEANSLVTRSFPIVEGTPSGIDGLDIAVLRIADGVGCTELPKPIPVSTDLAGPKGEMSSFCLIGFPGRPAQTSGAAGGVDWDWINATLFGNRYGVKRIAPGIAHRPLGTITADTRNWVFGHDATTLGGSSGSPVLAWRDADFAGFGIHFGGTTIKENLAHAMGQCRDRLVQLGIPIKDPE